MLDEEKDIEIFASEAESVATIAPGEIIIGNVVAINDGGQPLVSYLGSPSTEPLAAVSTLSITHQHIGRQAALLFSNGDLSSPVIMGLIHSPLNQLIDNFELSSESPPTEPADKQAELAVKDVNVDGQRVVIEGKEEVVLKCGDASITLTKAGKILIRGKYLLNRSDGVNRIMGGSVQVN